MGEKRVKFFGALYPLCVWAAALVAAGLLILCAWGAGEYALPLLERGHTALPDGWRLSGAGQEEGKVILPAQAACWQGRPLWLERELAGNTGGQYLHLKTRHMSLRAYWQGTLIYAYGEEGLPFSGTPGTVNHLVPLPASREGGQLRLEFIPLLAGASRYTLPLPLQGTRSALVSEVALRELPALVGAGMLVLAGAGLLLFGLLLPKRMQMGATLNYMGLFSLFAGCFAFFETDFARFLTGNPYLVHVGDALFLMLLPLPVTGLLLPWAAGRCRLLLYLQAAYSLLNILAQSLLNFACGIDVRYGAPASHLGVLLCMAGAAWVLIASLRGRGRQGALVVLALSPTVAGALLELAAFYFPLFPVQGFLFELGVFLSIGVQLYLLAKTSILHYKIAAQAAAYAKLALVDTLTEIRNRTAYQRKLQEISRQPGNYPGLWCLVMDINELKKANDTLGHSAGDALIKDTAALLRETFSPAGEVYRIGGDEFAALLYGQQKKDVAQLVAVLFQRIRAHNERVRGLPQRPQVTLAIGCARFRPGADKDLEQAFVRADDRMYKNKRRIKGEGGPAQGPVDGLPAEEAEMADKEQV